MKNALDWIKSNPISVAAAAVALVGFVVFAYFYVIAAPGWSKSRSEALNEPLNKQAALPESVPLPNSDPNAAPDNHTVVVNQRVIDSVKDIYANIRSQYDTILRETGDKNAGQHSSVMLGRGGIWPDADPDDKFNLYVQAKRDYLQHFESVFDFKNDNPWNMPRMVGGSPPRPREVQYELARTAFNFINSIGVGSANELSQTQANLLYAEQRTVLMSMLTTRARQLNIYVQLPNDQDPYAPDEESLPGETPGLGGGGEFEGEFGGGLTGGLGGEGSTRGQGTPPQYPFDIQPWAYSDNPPRPDQLWEGQVELWIIRDISKAIFEMNQVGKVITVTKPDGTQAQEYANVLNSPIKRLLKLDPLPGYVGLHTTGGVLEPSQIGQAGSGGSSSYDSGSEFDSGGEFGSSGSFGSSGAGSSGSKQSVYPTPPSSLNIPQDPTEAAPEHFGITPTGRVSNSAFDVRHTRLIIDIEWDELPAFIEQLRQTNFMTVVKANLQDIDEYQVLQEGYVYGGSDIVRAELIIESLWFRNWTSEFMPKGVKQKLLILPADGQGLGDDFGATDDGLGF